MGLSDLMSLNELANLIGLAGLTDYWPEWSG